MPLPLVILIVVAGLSGLAAAGIVPRLGIPSGTGPALRFALGTVAAAGVVLGGLAYLVRGDGPLVDADRAVSVWARDHATTFTDHGVTAVTRLGGTWVVAALGTVLAVAAWRRGMRAAAPFLAVVIVGNNLATNGVKALADRARPALEPVAQTLGPSFPSGHTSAAASFFAAAALVLGARAGRNRRALLAGAAVAAATAVACTRVLRAVHWLSDVAAGLVLGWAWFALCAAALGGRLLRGAADGREPGTRARAVAAPGAGS
ncbi:MAG: phosphatase PAP2 family protein [Thermoleophilia bacterium]|nr:phosphatase PAP2 family protein [Thermoleophilia bacterium]